MTDSRHEFGGPWTEVKLDALNEYSTFFTTALQNQNFTLWYVDAFAGTGERTATKLTGGIFENCPAELIEETLDGSAKRALNVEPPFRHIVLIDARAKHYKALCALADQNPNRDIRPIKGDANVILKDIVSKSPWNGGSNSGAQRAVVFLDPYGINVRWDTLAALAATKRMDIWYLVNLKGVYQQLARNHSGLDEGKRRALCDFFGFTDWEEKFYTFQPERVDMFDQLQSATGERIITREAVGEFYRRRLQEIFQYVSPPLSLTVRSLDNYFQLYCLSNNPSPAALGLIKRGAEAVIKKHAPAFHRMSAL